MERTLDRNGFLEMFEEQEDNRSSKEKNNSVLIMNKGTFQDGKTKGDFLRRIEHLTPYILIVLQKL